MRIMNKLRTKIGSIVLEAAIAMSLFLVLLCAAISSITAVNAELYMQRASENVVAELNVSIPFVSNGVHTIDEVISVLGISDKASIDTEKLDEALGMFGSASGMTGVDLEDIVGTTVFGRYIRDRIVTEYKKLVNGKWVYEKLLQNVSVYVDFESEDRSIYINVYYDIAAGNIKIPRSYCTSVALYSEAFPLREGDQEEEDATESVWDKDNFERGSVIRERFGGNLPYNFPVISSFKDDEIVSIKSMDLTSPYYFEKKNVQKKLRAYIKDIERFSGAEQSGVSVTVQDSTKRTLLLVIPENSPQEGSFFISEMKDYAAEHGVALEVVRHEKSCRYENPVEESPAENE